MSRKIKSKLDSADVALIVIIVGMIVACFALQAHRDARMDTYAAENSCEWHYDYYFNKEPVCK